jgi:isochorismate pyruvate lyase
MATGDPPEYHKIHLSTVLVINHHIISIFKFRTLLLQQNCEKMKEAKDCQNIQEIRANIDKVDYQILAYFGKRFEYVKEIVKFKTDQEEIISRYRQLEVFQKRREWAEDFGLDPELFEEIYKMLINWNVKKELEIFGSRGETNI